MSVRPGRCCTECVCRHVRCMSNTILDMLALLKCMRNFQCTAAPTVVYNASASAITLVAAVAHTSCFQAPSYAPTFRPFDPFMPSRLENHTQKTSPGAIASKTAAHGAQRQKGTVQRPPMQPPPLNSHCTPQLPDAAGSCTAATQSRSCGRQCRSLDTCCGSVRRSQLGGQCRCAGGHSWGLSAFGLLATTLTGQRPGDK